VTLHFETLGYKLLLIYCIEALFHSGLHATAVVLQLKNDYCSPHITATTSKR